jgi:phosphoribosylaminoimidazolecarboxamide formyltransferase/IMP cyclohydrolase
LTRTPIQRALISVYDKTGLEELARGLADAGVAIVSTGSTAARIAATGVPVTSIEQLTGFPECLDGRVKTLHPSVHAALLADVRLEPHRQQLDELGIEPFTLLVSNLYPFAKTVAAGAPADEVIEQIDIGGPAMVRGAAKNHANVAVVVDPARYPDILAAVKSGGFTLAERQRLAGEAFAHVATYDVHVASWMGSILAPPADGSAFPSWVGGTWDRTSVLRYGENPHQSAALYHSGVTPAGLASAEQLHGKEMSYNNYVDADAAWRCVHDFTQPAVVVVKHANPCGIAVGRDIAEAHRKAHATDPVSAFGGVIAANRTVTEEAAGYMATIFTEVVVAPEFDPAAVDILTKKKNIRLLRVPAPGVVSVETRSISGGLLMQQVDRVDAAGDQPAAWTLVAGEPADVVTLSDLEFAWRAVRSVKSNAILLATAGAAVGIGMGQVNRVDSCRLAVARADGRAAGSVAASDAFFPFADGLEILADAGVRAVVQPGGSVRDEDVIDVAVQSGITMYVTGTRHFFH